MHHITITREKGHIADSLRAYSVFVDSERVLQIREGECKQITVPPGVHSLSIRLDWCRSRTFTLDAEDGQSTALWCWPNARIYAWPFYLTFGWNRYIAVSNQPRVGRAPRKMWFTMYQIGLLTAALAFFGYESLLGKTVAIVALVPLLIFALVWLRLRGQE